MRTCKEKYRLKRMTKWPLTSPQKVGFEKRNLARVRVKQGKTWKTQKSGKSACKHLCAGTLTELEKEVKMGVGYRKIVSTCMLQS